MKRRKKLPFRLRMIQGAIGKRYVIKHYKWGIIQTKYPDMTKIKASPKQRTCRNLFREAVVYAQAVIADPVREAAWQKRLRRRKGVYNEAVKAYMLKDKRARERDELLTNMLIRMVFKNYPAIPSIDAAKAHGVASKPGHYESLFTVPFPREGIYSVPS
jgi:hypothetical protein